MSRFARSAHPRIAPCRPRIERLEPRRVLSFAAVAVDPAPGAHLTTPPAVLTVTFDHPIDPTSLGLGDIQLDEVDDSGGLTSIDGATEAVGPRDDQLILTPGQPLSPGHYEIILAGGSGLLSTDEENLSGLPLDGTDQALGDFWIVAKEGVGLGDAIDLGTPGSTPTSTRGPWTSRRIPTTWPCPRSPCPRGISGVSAWRSRRSATGVRSTPPWPSSTTRAGRSPRMTRPAGCPQRPVPVRRPPAGDLLCRGLRHGKPPRRARRL